MQSSAQATATGAAAAFDAGSGNRVGCVYLCVNSPAADSAVALQTSPDNTAWTTVDTVTGSGWAGAAMNAKTRAVRANVTALGTGGAPIGVNVLANPA